MVDLIIRTAGHTQCGNAGYRAWDDGRFHHTTQNGIQFKTYKLFISGIFRLVLLDCGWLWVAEPWKVRARIRRGYCMCVLSYLGQFLTPMLWSHFRESELAGFSLLWKHGKAGREADHLEGFCYTLCSGGSLLGVKLVAAVEGTAGFWQWWFDSFKIMWSSVPPFSPFIMKGKLIWNVWIPKNSKWNLHYFSTSKSIVNPAMGLTVLAVPQMCP